VEVTHSNILCSLLIGMRGYITPIVRAVSVDYSSEHIILYFYYDEQPSEDEEEYAEEIATEVLSSFPDMVRSFFTNKLVYPYPNKIPNDGFIVYLRYEPTPKEILNE
jgi:hypothetical protein